MDKDTTKREYRIFNDEVFKKSTTLPTACQAGPASFKWFPRLPAELRLMIWKNCLPSTTGRLISLFLARRVFACSESGYGPDDYRRWRSVPVREDKLFTERNELGNIVSGFSYTFMGVQDYGSWCRVLGAVNKEARDVYLGKYRLPVEICTEDKESGYRYSVLRIDPDNDIVELKRYYGLNDMFRLNAGVFLYALHDFMACDPKGKGIGHLAMGADYNDLSHIAGLQKDGIRPIILESMGVYLSRYLKTFYVVLRPSSEARNMFGSFSFVRGPYHVNRSIPVGRHDGLQRTVEFEYLGRDPRPIERDLVRCAVGSDPREGVYLWCHVLAKFGIGIGPGIAPPMEIRYLMGIMPHVWEEPRRVDRMVFTRGRFVEDLTDFEENWKEGIGRLAPRDMPTWGEILGSEEEWKRRCEELADVAGCWVFGADTFGEIGYDLAREDPEGNVSWKLQVSAGSQPIGAGGPSSRLWWKPKMVVDLSEKRRPGLMVFRFTEEKRG